MRHFLAFVMLVVAGLSACAATPETALPPTASPPPTATVAPVVAAVPPALEPAIPALRLCAQTVGIPLAVLTVPQEAALPLAANLRLWWGDRPPPNMAAFPLGEEQLAVIAHQGNNLPTSAGGLWRIVTGQVTTRLNNEGTPAPLTLWLPLAGSAEDARLSAWLGNASRRGDARLAPSPQAMLTAISNDPAAIGFLPAAWMHTAAAQVSAVQALPLPTPPAAWRAPVLVLLPPDAPPEARSLIACLQQGPGREALHEVYMER